MLHQLIGDIAYVVTFGSAGDAGKAGDDPTTPELLTSGRWWIATDADDAGDKAAANWRDVSWKRRLRPPANDWCDAAAVMGDVELRRWILDRIDPDGELEYQSERIAIAECDGCEPPAVIRPLGESLAELEALRTATVAVDPATDEDAAWDAAIAAWAPYGGLHIVASYGE